MRRNLQALGILWCIFGAYRVLAGMLGIFVLRAVATHNFGNGDWPFNGHMGYSFPANWMGVLFPIIATYTVISAALAIFTGISLLGRRSWGRTLALIAAVVTLFKFPLGTALGAYTLWVLTPGESAVEYQSITAQPYRA